MNKLLDPLDFFEAEISKAQKHLDGLLKAKSAYLFANGGESLANLTGTPTLVQVEAVSPKIEMAFYVDQVIERFPVGKEFRISDIYDLYRKDTDASVDDEVRDRASISSVLSRRTKKGKLEKLRKGIFRRQQSGSEVSP